MIEHICLALTNRIRKKMPEIDDERAEVINYGLQLIVGEVPKTFITLFIAYLLKVLGWTLLTVILLLPYRAFSGGFHLKTHIGCLVSTTVYYCGIAKISNYIFLNNKLRLTLALCVLIFGIIMVKFYAPADTENVPILRAKERKQKKVFSYISLIVGLIISTSINNNTISNILLLGNFIQSLMITPIAYKLTNNKYGYEVYTKDNTSGTLA